MPRKAYLPAARARACSRKGVLLGFHDNTFAHPERLVGFIADHAKTMKARSDHRLVITADTESPTDRLKLGRNVQELVRIA